ncbi:uncharacterized protein BP01DRAFT_355123 [Aspergillus saccharolyticus JOP 1030-1]|uniref:Uncharacterized protein n=1 Tax=Aspergillus saccharolyticus JOP 1030-1 TaxID=1450539 RepID=A0A319A3M1_9EURO|nr:hypothetical protein BP01DRAFT_355123 [Aspergillus saccharolyticus JOP 1030-1]PYH46728.1 hypothetical protein BP01DRAFT_355123 [Aspergillus saccharolyticus JOP 1030-1]
MTMMDGSLACLLASCQIPAGTRPPDDWISRFYNLDLLLSTGTHQLIPRVGTQPDRRLRTYGLLHSENLILSQPF